MISVIIPIYNVQPYLKRCVDSVCGQSYTDLEILLIDDGSTDESGSLCDLLAKSDSRIQVYHQENRGLSAARNLGLEKTNGDFIAFVDSDDFILPNMLQTLHDVLEKYDCDIASCSFIKFTDHILKIENSAKKLKIFSSEDALRDLFLSGVFQETVWNKLYRRSVLENLNFPVGKYHEDIFFTYQAFLHAKKIAAVDFIGYGYFQRQDSISGAKFSSKRFDALEGMAIRAEKIKKEAPSVYPEACLSLARNCLYQYQCALLSGESSVEDQKKIEEYFHSVYHFLPRLSGKEKFWMMAFAKAPKNTSQLRNRLHIGC